MDGQPRVLVTGGAGFVGIPLVAKLVATGWPIGVLDNFSVGSRSRLENVSGAIDVLDIDLTKEAAVVDQVRAWAPDICIHLAALHYIPYCQAHPAQTLHTNLVGTQHLLDALRGLPGPRRLLFTSTADVYRPSESPHRETSELGPDNVYGLSKLTGEGLVEQWARRTGAATTIVRLFNVYGPGETNPHVIPAILEQLHRGDRVDVGNMDVKRDFIYVDDVADVFLGLIAEIRRGLIVNVGTGTSHSLREILVSMQELLGRPLDIRQDPERMRASDRPDLRPDVTLLRRCLPALPPRELHAGLSALLRAEGLLSS